MSEFEELQNYIQLNFLKQYEEAINVVVGSNKPIRVLSHYDADGICAAGLFCNTLYREGEDFHLSIIHALDIDQVLELKKENNELIVFCDMGSGQVELIEKNLEGSTVVIFDHHYPLKESSKVLQVNPHFADIDGTSEACASTILFLLAIGVDAKNWDLYHLALAGAIGDKQHLGGLKGLNKKLLDAAISKDLITVSHCLMLDIAPLSEALNESLEPYFTGLSGRPEEVNKFLKKARMDGKLNINELPLDKKSELTSLLALKIISQGARRDIVEGIVADRYWSMKKNIDLWEFSSCVNACGRMGREEVGIGYCMDNKESMAEAITIRKEYRMKVREGLIKLEKEGAKKKDNIQYFYSPDSSIAGSHAGIGMMYFLDQEKPVLAISKTGKDMMISSRGTPYLVSKGLDLAMACRNVSGMVGGHGGGHDIAAGATIPIDKEKEFLDKFNEVIGQQFQITSEQK